MRLSGYNDAGIIQFCKIIPMTTYRIFGPHLSLGQTRVPLFGRGETATKKKKMSAIKDSSAARGSPIRITRQQPSLMYAKWRMVTSTGGPAPEPRFGHRAIAMKEQIVVFGGGNGGKMEDLYVLNTSMANFYT